MRTSGEENRCRTFTRIGEKNGAVEGEKAAGGKPNEGKGKEGAYATIDSSRGDF